MVDRHPDQSPRPKPALGADNRDNREGATTDQDLHNDDRRRGLSSAELPQELKAARARLRRFLQRNVKGN